MKEVESMRYNPKNLRKIPQEVVGIVNLGRNSLMLFYCQMPAPLNPLAGRGEGAPRVGESGQEYK